MDNALLNVRDWLKHFPFAANINWAALKLTPVGRYSISRPEHAEACTKAIALFLKDHGDHKCSDMTVTDATAGCGGNTLSLLKYFHAVVAIESNPEHFLILQNNLKVYHYEVSLANPKLQLINTDFTMVFQHLRTDVVFLDCPWNPRSGTWYSKHKHLMLYLSDIPVYTIVHQLLQNGCLCCCIKIPKNFDFSSFIRHMDSNITFKVVQVHSYFLMLCSLFG